MACGQLGLDIEYFYSLTPRQFFNIQRGFNERREAENLINELNFRRLAQFVVSPWSKNFNIDKVWPIKIPGVPEAKEVDLKDILEVEERYRERDKKKYTKPVPLTLYDLQALKKPS